MGKELTAIQAYATTEEWIKLRTRELKCPKSEWSFLTRDDVDLRINDQTMKELFFCQFEQGELSPTMINELVRDGYSIIAGNVGRRSTVVVNWRSARHVKRTQEVN